MKPPDKLSGNFNSPPNSKSEEPTLSMMCHYYEKVFCAKLLANYSAYIESIQFKQI